MYPAPNAARKIPIPLEDRTPAETITSRRRVTIGAIGRQESLAGFLLRDTRLLPIGAPLPYACL
ncbi:MAG TPA: hypothetical protein VL242_40515, partial [Sorangium sp.]|nr:hypothetical protein [Sorangium sp.]